jgi:hypothetical protein
MKIRSWLTFVFIIIASTRSYSSINSIFHLIDSQEFEKAKYSIEKESSKDTSNYAYNYLYAYYYFHDNSLEKNIYLAIEQVHICSVKYNYNNNAKVIIKNDKLGINSQSINQLYHQIELELTYRAKQVNTLESYEKTISTFVIDTILKNEMIKRRNDIAFQEANSKNDFLSFKEFMEKYPDANQAGLAKESYDKLLYKTATDKNTWQAYKNYIDNYPDAKFIHEAKEKYEILLFEDYNHLKDSTRIYEYITQYPNAKYRKDAELELFSIVCNIKSNEQLYYFISNYKNAVVAKNKAWDYLYLFSTYSDSPVVYSKFITNYPKFYNYDKFKEDSTFAYWHIEAFEKEGLYGYTKDDTIEILPATYSEASDFNGKLALVSTKCSNEKCTYGYINKNMKIVLSNYDEAYDFENGVAIIGSGDCPNKNCKYGLINEIGDTIIPINYAAINDINNGLLLTTDINGLSGFYNCRGQITIPFIYQKARNFKDSLALVTIDTNTYFINTNGQKQTQLPYFKLATDFENGFSSFTLDEQKWGLINKEGKIIFEPIYKGIIHFENGIAIASREDSIVKRGKTTYVLNTYELKMDGSLILKK